MKSVLIADDNPDMRQVMRLALQLNGYRVWEASNGREALAVQRQAPCDVLVTDLFMPDSDGFEAIEAFRREFPATRIIVMSGDSRLTRQNYLQSAALIGVDATLRKPFATEALIATLKKLG